MNDTIVMLEKFHDIMNLLGCIGYLMLNSAFNDLETAYGADAVVHTFIGKAYSGAIRAHLLAHQAISSILLEFNC